MLITNLNELAASKRILLLQGPIGSFFHHLSVWLTKNGCTVFKLNFNGGDSFFYSDLPNIYNYRDSLDNFALFLDKYVHQHQIQAIVCFGDTRPYHRIAFQYCQKHPNTTFWAFEEGYFRPEYITLEKDGVNDFSPLPRNADFFQNIAGNLPNPPEPKKVALGFRAMAKCSIPYYFYTHSKREEFPYYQHHRRLEPTYYIKLWLKSGLKRLYYYFKDRYFAKKIEKGCYDPFFVVPLQVYDDSQVKYHCDYSSVEDFLVEVLTSFIQFAPKQSKLIIKHHPMDRGFINYKHIIQKFKNQNSELNQRIFYVHDVPMPILLRRSIGMVTLNSTSGISALLHQVPVITLGRANYNMPKLTYQGNLDSFWHNATPPDFEVFSAYRKYHLYKTHINGSYYSKVILDSNN